MSKNTIVLNTGLQVIVNADLSRIFIAHNDYIYAQYTNGGGSTVTLSAGTVMGRITGSGLLLPLVAAASDGSQLPVGILADDYTVAAGATATVWICVKGDVVDSAVVFNNGTDTLDTVVSARRLRDRIASDTVGIRLVPSTELTVYDNQ